PLGIAGYRRRTGAHAAPALSAAARWWSGDPGEDRDRSHHRAGDLGKPARNHAASRVRERVRATRLAHGTTKRDLIAYRGADLARRVRPRAASHLRGHGIRRRGHAFAAGHAWRGRL